MTGFRRRDPDAAALRRDAGKDSARRAVRARRRAAWLSFAGLVAAIGATGCNRAPVEILSDNSVIYPSALGNDRLLLDGNLRFANQSVHNYQQPPHNLTVDVDSPGSNVELLFMEDDSEATWKALQLGGCNGDTCAFSEPLLPAQHTEIGIIHSAGAHTDPIGKELALFNPGQDQAVAIRSLYMRRHGECELGVKWGSLLPGVLAEAKDETSKVYVWVDGILQSYDYQLSFQRRAAMSYLRQTAVLYGDSSNTQGRGGFGLYVQGHVDFDAFYLAGSDLRAKAEYDVNLSGGLPHFSVFGAPLAYTYNCNGTCIAQSGIEEQARNMLSGVAGRLNDKIDQCLQVEADILGPSGCPDPSEDSSAYCANGRYAFTSSALGQSAQSEAQALGATAAQANAFFDAMRDPKNWACGPVSDTCAELTHQTATTKNVCKLKLRATDVVPMPDEVNLVWYPGGLGTAKPTAAQALYLALKFLESSPNETLAAQAKAELPELCSGNPDPYNFREFVKVSK